MSKVQPGQCSNDARGMIPWYVNGTLSDAEAALVREHIDVCSDCQTDVGLHTRIHAAVIENDVSPITPKTSASDILSGDGAARSRSTPSVGNTRQSMAVAAGLAILGVALIAWLIVDRNIENTNRQFQTATSAETGANIDYVLQLRFDAGVSEQQRREIVAQMDDVVKWTTVFSGDYEIHVRLSAPTFVALEQYRLRAESISGVQSAEFTALQLPMR